MRRLLLALVILGLSVASSAVPAAGQSTPPQPVRVTTVSPPCAPLNQRVAITVGGTSARGARGGLTLAAPSGSVITKATWFDADEDGRWSVAFPAITTTLKGSYTITATDGFGNRSTAYFSAPCPRVELDPPCSVAGRPTTLTVFAFDFAPNDRGYVFFDYSGPNSYGQERIRIQIDGAGNFATTSAYGSTPFSVIPPDRDVPIHVEDLRDNVIDVLWPRCPSRGVTTTSTSTIPLTPDTTTTTEMVTIPSTTVVRLPEPGPTTTSTTTVVPPPTPGASLTLTPSVGPPGFVTLAQGTGFPPGPVTLTWTRGLGFTPATAGPDGTFAVRVLVFPKDRLGPRAAVASAGGVTANAAFLVVPPTVQPSGSDVTQITRIRRFNQR